MDEVINVGSQINWFDVGFQIIIFVLLISLIVFLIKFSRKQKSKDILVTEAILQEEGRLFYIPLARL
ncbi:hypothetical protein [Bacillus sp. ISL-57]|uniref:hypothetical protein n=1 Tax=Bacillus sp. ISL-57 TaxID=2819135 RepID=UPI001BE9063E|nr:hypothetical protein [Bacillus sp. ISL-57]MBT2719172.1 hypothetical protein [Bacillus sp. ISL-57]